jgi:hypothetical protein
LQPSAPAEIANHDEQLGAFAISIFFIVFIVIIIIVTSAASAAFTVKPPDVVPFPMTAVPPATRASVFKVKNANSPFGW